MTSGVYRIRIGEFIYIGASGMVEGRVKNHVWALGKGNHKNKIMQEAWEAAGGAWCYDIVYIGDDLEQMELTWINRYWGTPGCLNQRRIAAGLYERKCHSRLNSFLSSNREIQEWDGELAEMFLLREQFANGLDELIRLID